VKDSDDTIDTAGIGMKPIEAQLIGNQGEDQDGAGNAGRKAHDIDKGIGFIFPEITPGEFELVFKHAELIVRI
jgi:hypothetical protein